MRIQVNGEAREVEDGLTLEALVARLASDPRRVATLVNEDVVPAARRAARVLQPGDAVELLGFAGGG